MAATTLLPATTCSAYGKRTGVFVGSGLLAIESALRLAGVRQGELVVVPRLCCWKVPGAVVRAGCRPVVCDVTPDLVLDPERACSVARRLGVRAVIAVHYLGLPADITSLIDGLPRDTIVVEDAAQSWGLFNRGQAVGKCSDFVATSFGPTKPCALGFGGGVLFNDPSLSQHFELEFTAQRARLDPPLPYALPVPETLLADAELAATQLIAERRVVAEAVRAEIGSIEGLRLTARKLGDSACWHRIPVFFHDSKMCDRFATLALRHRLRFQPPHELDMFAIPFLRREALREDDAPMPFHLLLYPTSDTVEGLRCVGRDWGALP